MTAYVMTHCTFPGCEVELRVLAEHLPNVAPSWRCPAHREEMRMHDRPTRRRRATEPCPFCKATTRGCETSLWLRGRRCCATCSSVDHERGVS